MDTGLILENIIYFLFVALIFMAVLSITFKITLKNYNVKTSKLKFYGLFLGMDNKSILAFSCITLNYIFFFITRRILVLLALLQIVPIRILPLLIFKMTPPFFR